MTIEVLDPSRPPYSFEADGRAPFELFQTLVAGYVECVTLPDCQVLCNEDGLSLRLPPNPQATRRFAARINMGPGAVGVWIVLTGKDMLE